MKKMKLLIKPQKLSFVRKDFVTTYTKISFEKKKRCDQLQSIKIMIKSFYNLKSFVKEHFCVHITN